MTNYEKQKQHESDITWVNGIVASAQKREWFGEITLKVEGGMMKRAITAQSHVPPKVR